MKPGNIILLNGTSSSGKSSIARAVQDESETPFLHIGIDTFILALPARYWDPATTLDAVKTDTHVRHGFHFVSPGSEGNPGPWPLIACGPVADRAIESMHRAVSSIAHGGGSVILDHVFLKSTWYEDFEEATAGLNVLKVKVHCSREELERREKERGDRMEHLAWSHEKFIHYDIAYDLSLDTGLLSPQECAKKTITMMESIP
jgi:chloramphenicol 3-O phosphotransferase